MSAEPGPLQADQCRVEDLAAVVEVELDRDHYPRSVGELEGALVYDPAPLDTLSPAEGALLRRELATALLDGPGIVVFPGAFTPDVIDAATTVFEDLMAAQRARRADAGDHFAAPGANDRVWNSLEKLGVTAPEVFVAYHDNPSLDLVASAWLGPGYQVTAQVNSVNPGAEAQSPHRDYHLGFMSDEQAESYPRHVHGLSPLLTLQGAVAHVDMPVPSGPTCYLPHSQKYEAGYLAWRQADMQAYFEAHHSQPPLAKGDAVFFNPALLHGAGANRTTGQRRLANLLQISSPFGRAMEHIDRRRLVGALYPTLLAAQAEGRSPRGLARVVAASAEGYPFPADLDHDQPMDGMAPASMAQIVTEALAARLSPEELADRLDQRFGSAVVGP